MCARSSMPIGSIGQIGGGKIKRTGVIDVAVIQSLQRKGDVEDFVADYGHVIVDECHHLSAVTFERVLRRVKAKYVLGLTATPIRRDGHHPIVYMQCGPVRFHLTSEESSTDVTPRTQSHPTFYQLCLGTDRNRNHNSESLCSTRRKPTQKRIDLTGSSECFIGWAIAARSDEPNGSSRLLGRTIARGMFARLHLERRPGRKAENETDRVPGCRAFRRAARHSCNRKLPW